MVVNTHTFTENEMKVISMAKDIAKITAIYASMFGRRTKHTPPIFVHPQTDAPNTPHKTPKPPHTDNENVLEQYLYFFMLKN